MFVVDQDGQLQMLWRLKLLTNNEINEIIESVMINIAEMSIIDLTKFLCGCQTLKEEYEKEYEKFKKIEAIYKISGKIETKN